MTLSGWEAVFFWVFALAAMVAALFTVMARNAVHSALFLISTLVSVAALFILLGAEFVAGVQILVYVGGVMVLFLFVVMLVNVGVEERGGEELFNRPAQVGMAVFLALLLVPCLIYAINNGMAALRDRRERPPATAQSTAASYRTSATHTMQISQDTKNVADSLYRFGALPFEIASVLLLVAIVGSVLLARTSKQEVAADDVAPEVLQEIVRAEPEIVTETSNA